MVNWNMRDADDGKTRALGAMAVQESHCAGCKARSGAHMVTKDVWHVPSRSAAAQGFYAFHTVRWDEMWDDWTCTCEADKYYRLSKGQRARCAHVREVTADLQARYTPTPAPPKRLVRLEDLFD